MQTFEWGYGNKQAPPHREVCTLRCCGGGQCVVVGAIMNNNANKFILKNNTVENPEFNFENKNNSIIDFPSDIPHTKLDIEKYDILDVETPEALWTY